MATDAKVLVELDIQGDSVWVTDKTGEYNVTTNPGGHGSPNPELSTMALAVVAVRNSVSPSNLSPVGADVIYDNAALNTKQTSFELSYSNDGWHSIALFVLPVSTNGTTDLNGNSLSEGDYFYYTSTGKVSKISSGSPVEVTDYSEIIGDGDVVQEVCERLFMANLAIKKKNIYWDYRKSRNTKGQCKETENLRRTLVDLRLDMEGAFDAFWSGLTTEAHDVTESLLKQHKLT